MTGYQNNRSARTISRIAAALALGTAVWMTAAAGPVSAGGAQGSSPAGAGLKDIQGHWAEKTITRLVQQGILDGFPDGTFRPDEPVTADQFIKMLLLSYSTLYPNGERKWSAGFTASLSPANRTVLQQDYAGFSFKPSLSGYWAKPFIDLANDLHFITKSQFPDFKSNLKREQVSEIVYFTMKETEYLEDEIRSRHNAERLADFYGAKDREQRFVAEAFGKGIMEGYPDGYFGIGRDVTRAEALTILGRITDPSARVSTPVNQGDPSLERIVPTLDGHYKKVVFPNAAMAKAYGTMTEAAMLRGTNYDLVETSARLFKDASVKAQSLVRTGGTGEELEEASLWMEPAYNTYGITVRVQEGTLARNQESIYMYADQLFGTNALEFHRLFTEVCAKASAGESLAAQTVRIGGYAVDIQAGAAPSTVLFTILEKK